MKEYYIGLMSGTSMDGIDAVLVDFATKPFSIINYHNAPIPSSLKEKLTILTEPSADEIRLMGNVDSELGVLFAEVTKQLLAKSHIKASDVIAIGSHGQTIRHFPNDMYPFTLQIGDPNIIAELTKITTVADFRRKDIACKGQGAPLAPAFHHYAFQSQNKDRIILNIGGIANITFLPANSNKPIIGFDTGPGNTLLDHWIKINKDQEFDENGAWAQSGNVIEDLLVGLISDPYFQQNHPKSTGREYFNLDWLNKFITHQGYNANDIQATLSELTAKTIFNATMQICSDNVEVIICGGGINNRYLLSRLKYYFGEKNIFSTSDFGLAPQLVECTAFAWFARQTILKQQSNIPSVTGASSPVILGGVYYV